VCEARLTDCMPCGSGSTTCVPDPVTTPHSYCGLAYARMHGLATRFGSLQDYVWSCLDYSNGMICSRCFTNYGHCLFFSTGQNSQYDFHDPRDAPWSIQYTRTQTKLSRVAVEKQRYEIDPPFAGSDVTTVALGITSCRCKTERLQRSQDRML
jgi:hypothetical protein